MNQLKKTPEKIWGCTRKTGISVLTGKVPSMYKSHNVHITSNIVKVVFHKFYLVTMVTMVTMQMLSWFINTPGDRNPDSNLLLSCTVEKKFYNSTKIG